MNQISFKLNVTINGEPVTTPITDLQTCCCGQTVGTADDLSECFACGGFMCMGADCDCPCRCRKKQTHPRHRASKHDR